MLYSKKYQGFFTSVSDYPNYDLSDAVKISADEHSALLQGEPDGKLIAPDKQGRPVLIDKAPQGKAEAALSKIREIELTITDRRIREAVLGLDTGWLAEVNAKIAALRGEMK